MVYVRVIVFVTVRFGVDVRIIVFIVVGLMVDLSVIVSVVEKYIKFCQIFMQF